MSREVADAVMAHAVLALRVVDTMEDLAGLRVGAVVRDADHAVLEKVTPEWWQSPGEATEYEDEDVDLPAVVLYEPGVGE